MTGPAQPPAAQSARRWLQSQYDVPLDLSPAPVAETPQTWVFSVASLPVPGDSAGTPLAPMLTSLVCVPKNGVPPFHPATDDPWGDLAAFERDPRPRDPAAQARRTNARGAVLAAHAAIGGAPAEALPWQPGHERARWWEEFVRRYFPTAEVGPCADWETVIAAVREPGPGTGGVVWVRRELHGAEATGHLLYAHNRDGQVSLLDPQAGRLARLETANVREIVLARIPPQSARPAPAVPAAEAADPAERPRGRAAGDLAAAVRAAEVWLNAVHGGEVALVDPSPADELARGWLFACNTRAFLEHGRPQDAMLDAALVVPKDGSVPFGLPNSDPWAWLSRWDEGGEPGREGLALPPEPGPAAWFGPTMRPLGTPTQVVDFADWPPALAEVATMPEGSRAVVWVRRNDRRGRESVGLLCVAAQTPKGLVLVDAARDAAAELELEGVRSVHVIHYR